MLSSFSVVPGSKERIQSSIFNQEWCLKQGGYSIRISTGYTSYPGLPLLPSVTLVMSGARSERGCLPLGLISRGSTGSGPEPADTWVVCEKKH